jgi:hypothetical protein
MPHLGVAIAKNLRTAFARTRRADVFVGQPARLQRHGRMPIEIEEWRPLLMSYL